MKLNLDEVKKKLTSNEDVLIDPGYLKDDMISIYEYYSDVEESDEIPNPIMEWMDNHLPDSEFDFVSFAEAYFESQTSQKVKGDYTQDGWLKFITNN